MPVFTYLYSDYDYYEDRVRIPEEEHRRRIAHQMQYRRGLRNTNDPFAIAPTEFYRLYRMHQQRVFEIAGIIEPYMPERRGFTYLPVKIKVRLRNSIISHTDIFLL